MTKPMYIGAGIGLAVAILMSVTITRMFGLAPLASFLIGMLLGCLGCMVGMLVGGEWDG